MCYDWAWIEFILVLGKYRIHRTCWTKGNYHTIKNLSISLLTQIHHESILLKVMRVCSHILSLISTGCTRNYWSTRTHWPQGYLDVCNVQYDKYQNIQN